MKNSMAILIAFAAVVVLAGCAPMVYINPRQLSVDEIISMSTQGVSKDVIIQHINSTHSRFKLTAEDVVKLTQAKVDPDVIKAMLKSEDAYSNGQDYPYSRWGNSYRGYPYYNYYWYDYPGYYNYYSPYSYYRSYSPYYYRGYDGRGYGGYRGYNEQRRGGGEPRGGMGRR